MALSQVGLERLNTATTKKIGKRKNIIINGDFRIAERGTSSTSGGYQTVDRFRCNNANVDEAPTQAQHALTSSDTGPYAEGFRFSYHITNGNQTSGAGTSDSIEILTKLEAGDIANSGWDYTSSSSYLTFSFWVKSSVAQNFFGYLKTADGTSQRFPFQTGSLSADTWTKITKKIPGNSNLAFDADAAARVNEGLRIVWAQFYGTDKTSSDATLDTWGAYSSAQQTPDQTSTWYTTNNSTFEITGVQLEVGEVRTPFETRSLAEEERLCKRYYISSTDFHHICVNNGESDRWIRFMVEMRAAPTVTTSPTNSVSFAAQNQTKHGFAGNGSGASLANFNMPWTADAEL